ncbi:MAG TPA: M20/M25/M40 family metallo-hydrolase [Thermoanaerobaculia bacterium]|jgi:acetylornithine deacetylase|nr:M20/M25/M40 family metallo-hydrolase [Thermoanaerobaculia bacterium]
MEAEALLALHRRLVAIPSVSGEEAAIAGFLEELLREGGATPLRLGDTLLAIVEPASGGGRPAPAPLLLLDTHLDTVPPGEGWSRDPFTPVVIDGRVHGLGSNDAKASVAAMTAAFLALRNEPLPFALGLALVEGEETRGAGTQRVLAALAERGVPLLGAVFGEPTSLDLASAQKGLLVLELVARGQGCHAAHAAALGADNAALLLARDLLALAGAELAPPHPRLGATTLQPTVVRAGTARNVVPAEATAVLDVRTTPAASHDEVVARVRALAASEVRVLSSRLEPRETAEDALVVRAALLARPAARLYGSPTLSDLVHVASAPAIKCGPGVSERSHTADEWVGEDEIVAGAAFYQSFVRQCATLVGSESGVGAGLVPANTP